MKKSNLKKLTVTAILAAVAGIRFKMCTGTASGKYFVCSYRRSLVGIGTGVYRIFDP